MMTNKILSAAKQRSFLPTTTTGTEKGMTIPNARRSFRLIKRTEERKKVFEESATAASARHAIDREGRPDLYPEPFVPTKDSPERHIHPRHKRTA
jgi:hypothetical protein